MENNEAPPPVFISESKIKTILTWPLVNEAVEEALKSASGKDDDIGNESFTNQPARSFTFTKAKAGVLLSMPGYVGNYSIGGKKMDTLACKLVTSFNNNQNRQPPLPNILANIFLFDCETGKLKCIMEGTEITAWRTASASAVATRHLYFNRLESTQRKRKILSILGCGVQGNIHAHGFSCSFDEFKEIRLWNRTPQRANSLAKLLEDSRNKFLNKDMLVEVAQSIEDCVRDADVVVTTTFSPNPLLQSDIIKKEVHINAIGASTNHHSEISEELYLKSSVYIDNWASAKTELKDLKANIICEVGDIINGVKSPEKGVTVFQSMGMAAEDATVAQTVYEAFLSSK